MKQIILEHLTEHIDHFINLKWEESKTEIFEETKNLNLPNVQSLLLDFYGLIEYTEFGRYKCELIEVKTKPEELTFIFVYYEETIDKEITLEYIIDVFTHTLIFYDSYESKE